MPQNFQEFELLNTLYENQEIGGKRTAPSSQVRKNNSFNPNITLSTTFQHSMMKTKKNLQSPTNLQNKTNKESSILEILKVSRHNKNTQLKQMKKVGFQAPSVQILRYQNRQQMLKGQKKGMIRKKAPENVLVNQDKTIIVEANGSDTNQTKISIDFDANFLLKENNYQTNLSTDRLGQSFMLSQNPNVKVQPN